MNTHDQIPLESILSWVDGSPQGRDYAPPGYVEIDRITSNWWLKTTTKEYNTGWVLFGGSPGATFTSGVYYPDTLAALKAIATTVITPVQAFMRGYLTIGDGLGRIYYWAPASTTSDLDPNGNQLLNVVRPNDVPAGSAGRWIEYSS